MSLTKYKIWEAPFYNIRGRETTWINGIHTSHDLFCGCDSPDLHLLACLFFPAGTDDDSLLQRSVQRLKGVKQHPKLLCLTGTADGEKDTPATEDGPDILDHLTDGDLEKLFEDDIEEEDATG